MARRQKNTSRCQRWDILLTAGFFLGVVVALMFACKVGRPFMRERAYRATRCGVVHVRFLNRTECHSCRGGDARSHSDSSSEEWDEDWMQMQVDEQAPRGMSLEEHAEQAALSAGVHEEEMQGWYAWVRQNLEQWFSNLPDDLQQLMAEWELDWGTGFPKNDWGMPEWGHHGDGHHPSPPGSNQKCDWWETFLKPHHDSAMHGMSPAEMAEMTDQDWQEWWQKVMATTEGDEQASKVGINETKPPVDHEKDMDSHMGIDEETDAHHMPPEDGMEPPHMGPTHSGHGSVESHRRDRRHAGRQNCPQFDCIQVEVFYHSGDHHHPHHHHAEDESRERDQHRPEHHPPPPQHNIPRAPSFARVHYSLKEVDKYPHCSYSSCMKDNFENDDATDEFLRSMELALRGDHSLLCYHDPEHPDHVILTKLRSFKLVLHCLLWPMAYAVLCILALMFRHCYYHCRSRNVKAKHVLKIDPETCATVSGGTAQKYALPPGDISRPDGPAILEGEDVLPSKAGAWFVGPEGPPQYTQIYDGEKISLPPAYDDQQLQEPPTKPEQY